MGVAHKLPCSYTFGQPELNVHIAVGIGYEVRIEESGLVEVLAHLHIIEHFTLFFRHFSSTVHYRYASGLRFFLCNAIAYGNHFLQCAVGRVSH